MSKLFKIGFFLLLLAAINVCCADATNRRGTVSVQKGNILYTTPSGTTEILTRTGDNGAPALSPNGELIAFTRVIHQEGSRSADLPVRDLWVINVDNHKATRLVAGKPGGEEIPEQTLADIDQPTFSPDSKTIYFMTAAWATSAAIHAVPATGGKQRFITNGNSLTIIQRGEYKGALLVEQHRYKDRDGSWDPQVLISPAGKTIKILGEIKNALQIVESKQ
jgi:Tol biopolymer transport system component